MLTIIRANEDMEANSNGFRDEYSPHEVLWEDQGDLVPEAAVLSLDFCVQHKKRRQFREKAQRKKSNWMTCSVKS